ncbi:protein inscuteable homolog isoform X2 [Macrobrachium nipponense]|uniref:protein inscuteable homolog isoform X2 n=1 Tax=Macrobrachium nipponense TaxID=159736 RepID=UPI0030C842FC
MSPAEGAGLSVGGRGQSKETPPPARSGRQEREVKVTPFKRSRSRVYYASQSDGWTGEAATPKDKPVCRDLNLRSSPGPPTGVTQEMRNTSAGKSSPADRSPYSFRSGGLRKLSQSFEEASSRVSPPDVNDVLREAVILETGEDAVSSGEEAGEVSPGGSFRGSLRGSPSHRSQDSGYSDSGESTNAQNDSDGPSTTPPNVKHITRVYFSDGLEQARLYNDKIVCSPEVNGSFISPRPSPSGRTAAAAAAASAGIPQVSPGSRGDASLEELSEELETKSILEAAIAKRTGAVRKRTPNVSSAFKRGQRKSSSSEKLTADGRAECRRPAPLRARRRCSAGDLHYQQQQHQQQQHAFHLKKHAKSQDQVTTSPTYTSQSTSTIDLGKINQGCGGTGRLGGACSLDALDDPVPASRVAGHLDASSSSAISSSSPVRPSSLAASLSRPQQTTRRLRIHPVAIAKEMRNESVSQWLRDLHLLYEAECMNTLQSKSLPGDCGNTKRRAHNQAHATTRYAIRAIQRRAHAVSTEFARLCQRLEWLELDQVPSLAESLVGHIRNFLRDYTTQWTAADPDLQPQSSLGRQSKVIQQICERLTEVCDKISTKNDKHDDNDGGNPDGDRPRQVVQVVTALGHAFTKLVDLMLSREIKVVVQVLEEPDAEENISSAVSHLTALGVDGGHICRLIARLGGVRALLGLCLEPRLSHVRVASLRALATVCCVVEGIEELEKAGGIEVVSEVLCDPECPEEERSEAAGVLAQVTSPWVENNHRLTALYEHIHSIVIALTGLADSTRSAEIFLLASAALANLTFLDGGCVEAMRKAGTAKVLLKAAKGNPNLSVFTKDQIATVLANLAGSRETAEEVVACGGVNILLGLLNTRPAPTHRLPEVATAERIQQKSAIALSRLCNDPDVAKVVAESGGAERLVHLCKDENERNHSDAVLVACLAALRKIASSLGSDELRDMDAAELVEPRLLDSFLIYSSRQESYV